ncbi:hypothetical protein IAU59_001541 [Kwoniella sp. CBS 9459]
MAFNRCAIPNCIYQALLDGRRSQAALYLKYFGGWEPEIPQMMALLNSDETKSEVETLRPGCKVSKVHLHSTVNKFAFTFPGMCNFHIKIEFEDDSLWLMRIRRWYTHRLPEAPLWENVKSEVAVCRLLHAAGLKAPMAYLPPSDSKMHHKLIYCYQEWVAGQAWEPLYDRFRKEEDDLSDMTIQHIRSVADWFLRLEGLTFEQVGSPAFTLRENDSSCQHSSIEIGPHIERRPASVQPPYYHGPFGTSKERWISSINTRLRLLLRRELVATDREIDLYLALIEARSLIQGCAELDNPGPFYIKHDDDRGDHIRAAEDGAVTGVIDWEWAYTTNKEEAFCAPIGWAHKQYRNGKNDVLVKPELCLIEAYTAAGRPDLGDCVRGGRKYHRLNHFMRFPNSGYINLNALRRAFLNQPDDMSDQPESQEEWIALKKEEFKDDEGLTWLLANPVVVQAEPSAEGATKVVGLGGEK